MPVYNAQKYLREAIDSILQQTFTNFEFLIIDDGSTDASVDIIRSYTDPRIKFVQNEKNFGITFTLNRGISLADTEYIARMDADDVSHPERLEKQYQYALANPECALISTWVRQISDDGQFEKLKGPKAGFIYSLMYGPSGIFHPTTMYKKSAVLHVGMYSQEYAEDYNLWCKMARNFKIGYLRNALLDYRSSNTSLWRHSHKEGNLKALDVQVLKNVQYYTNDSFKLSNWEVQFLREHTDQTPDVRDQGAVIECFKKLDLITSSFLTFQDCNCTDKKELKHAALEHKRRLLERLEQDFTRFEIISLMIRLCYWEHLYHFIRKKSKFAARTKLTLIKQKFLSQLFIFDIN